VTGYSLVTERWMPVVMRDGTTARVGLQEALVSAHQIRMVADQSPLVTVALHRLLLALLYRIFSPESPADWKRLWRAGQFSAEAVIAYLREWEGRFDLFHPTHPFYQVTELPEAKEKGVEAIVHEAASGNNPTLFDHGGVEGADALTPDRAACYLLAYQQFAVAGGISKPFNFKHGPLTAGVILQAVGQNLFETLLLHLLPLRHWTGIPQQPDDAPWWERDGGPEPQKEGQRPRGPLDYLTWQSRRIRLIRKGSQVVACQVQQGYALPETGEAIDPYKAYKRVEEIGYLPDKLARDRAAWQYAHVLLAQSSEERLQAGLLLWLGRVQEAGLYGEIQVDPVCQLAAHGLIMGDQAGKIEAWRREQMPLPLAYLQDAELVAHLKEALDLAWQVEGLLRRVEVAIAWVMAERSKAREAVDYLTGRQKQQGKIPDSVKGLIKQYNLVTAYWPRLEAPLRSLLLELPQSEPSKAKAAWGERVVAAAKAPFATLRDQMVQSGAPWAAMIQIDGYLNRRLKSMTAQEGVTATDESEADREAAPVLRVADQSGEAQGSRAPRSAAAGPGPRA
jgi:CRISPR system Cascade subunit CasA